MSLSPQDSREYKAAKIGLARSWRDSLAADVVALTSIAGLVLLFFPAIALEGRVPLGYDLLAYFYPYKVYTAELISQGQIPLWNPRLFMGVPLLANIQNGVLYPPNLIFYLIPTVDALRLSVLLHIWAAGAFTYLFLRLSMGMSPWGAWVGGLVFAFGGFIGAHVGHLNQLQAAVWLPLALTCLERSVTVASVRWSVLGGLAVSAQLLAGHTQELYYSGWVLAAAAIFLALRPNLDTRGRLLGLVSLSLMAVLAAGLSAVQLLPTLELAALSYRSGGLSLKEASGYSLQLRDILDTILPLYWWAPYVDVTGYTGAVSLVLAPASLALRRQRGWALLFGLLACLAFVLSLGDQTPLFGLFHEYTPGFDLFRAAGRWLFVYGFSMAALAGLGTEALWREGKEPSGSRFAGAYGFGLLAIVIVFLTLGLWANTRGVELDLPHPRVLTAVLLFMLAGIACSLLLASKISRRMAVVLLGVLLCGELYMAREPLEANHPVPSSMYSSDVNPAPHLAGSAFHRSLVILADRPGSAISTEMASYIAGIQDKEERQRLEKYAAIKAAGAGDITMTWGLNSPDGYDGGLLPLASYAQLLDGLLPGGKGKADITMRELLLPEGRTAVPDSSRMALLGVGKLLVGEEVEVTDVGWRLAGSGYPGQTKLLTNEWSRGRVAIVHSAVVEPDSRRALEHLLSADPPGSQIALAEGTALAEAEVGGDSIEIQQDTSSHVVVATRSQTDGYLVLRDSYYPGWRAQVDGVEAQVLRADLAFRAVPLPPGSHSVRFFYDPASLKIGLFVSLLSWVSACGLFFGFHRIAPRLRIR